MTLPFRMAALALPLLLPLALFAKPLPAPEGPVLLTVEAPPERGADPVQLDLALLRSLPATTYRTATIWTEGLQVFTGVTLKDLAEALGLQGTAIRAHAINDYAIDIPWSDVASGYALVAYMRNGAPMSVREKGPLWIVFPFDRDTRFRQETYHSRSIWQLDRLEVRH